MYWVLFFLYCSQPVFLLPGLMGVFGEEGKRAADDAVPIIGVSAIIAIAIVGCFILFARLGFL